MCMWSITLHVQRNSLLLLQMAAVPLDILALYDQTDELAEEVQ